MAVAKSSVEQQKTLPGLCPFAQMDETVYLVYECQTGFFAWSHESTDVQKNPCKVHGELAGLLPRKTSPGGVCGFFDEVEKPTHPTPIGLAASPPASKQSRFCMKPGHCYCAARNGQSPVCNSHKMEQAAYRRRNLWVARGLTSMRMKLSGLPLCKAHWGLQTLNRCHLR